MNKITYFGLIADQTKVTEEVFNFENKSVKYLKDWLFEKYPNIKEIKFQMAVNLKLENEDRIILQGEDIAILPPFAGG